MCWMDKLDIHTGCVGWRRWMTHWMCWMDTLDVLDGDPGWTQWMYWMEALDA